MIDLMTYLFIEARFCARFAINRFERLATSTPAIITKYRREGQFTTGTIMKY